MPKSPQNRELQKKTHSCTLWLSVCSSQSNKLLRHVGLSAQLSIFEICLFSAANSFCCCQNQCFVEGAFASLCNFMCKTPCLLTLPCIQLFPAVPLPVECKNLPILLLKFLSPCSVSSLRWRLCMLMSFGRLSHLGGSRKQHPAHINHTEAAHNVNPKTEPQTPQHCHWQHPDICITT